MVSQRASDRIFLGAAGLLFITSTALASLWCRSMSAMGSMLMPGGWTMSMTWTRMPGQTWTEAAASFFGMWLAMMIAMMLPSATLMLSRYRRLVAQTDSTIPTRLTVVLAGGYFAVWALAGIIVYGVGALLAQIEMQHPSLASTVPALAAICVLVAGGLQFTSWKAHHLACCRLAQDSLDANIPTAWWQGFSLGFHCSCCCLNLTVILLVLGVMDIRAMAVVTAAITLERLAPAGKAASQIIGGVAVGFGASLFLRALGLV